MPATIDDTLVSPNANRANGIELNSVAIANRCSHVRRPRGRRSRRATRIATSASAPSAQRANATWSGAKSSTPTLMNRKLEPQMELSSRKIESVGA
jgi:hypothetical protein